MKKKVVGLLVIVLAVTIIFTLTGCNKKAEKATTLATTTLPATTAANETTAVEKTTNTDETTIIDETTVTVESSTVIVSASTTVASTNKPIKTTKPVTTKPTTIADIVSYYNLASNKAKKDKPGYKLVTTDIIGDITSSYGSIQWLAGKVVPMFSTDPKTIIIPKGDSSSFPVKGQNYGSKIVPSSLKSATCVDKGATYEIKLIFKDEKLNDLPSDVTKIRHGQGFNVLTKQLVDNETQKFSFIVKLEKFAPTYTGCYIKCNVEKATGNLLNATYYCVNNSDVIAKVGFTSFDAKVFFGNKEEYTLNY